MFLSYSSKDKEIVHALAERLTKDAVRVWLDVWEIKPGDLIPMNIQHGVEKSRTMVMCMSPDYFASEWGRLEHHSMLFRDPTNALRRFLPLLIKDCQIPDIIALFAHIDWRTTSDEAYETLLVACNGYEADTKKEAGPKRHVDGARMVLKGHDGLVVLVAVTPDGKTAVSSSADKTLKVWDFETGHCRATFGAHTHNVVGVAITPDGKTVVSSAFDKTLKVWDLETGHCRATFEGHTDQVYSVAITPDGKMVVSASSDATLKVWDLETGQCRATFEGHASAVMGVAVTPDGKAVISSSWDRTLRVWDIPGSDTIGEATDSARYTNAKVVLVGESGVGKTGLALRLAEGRWQETESTHGMNVWPLELPGLETDGMEREVWLWDFAGQLDYRLIHQLYMDETALGVVVFNPQDDNPFENIGYWDKALSAARKKGPDGVTKHDPAKLLVAARCDRGGITISGKRFEDYVAKHGFAGFLITGAKIGEGCEELKTAVARYIPWERLPWTATSRLFKTLKDAILKLTEQDVPLARLSELRQRLQLSLPRETIGEADLRAVVGLLQGQGVVQMRGFGDFILLQPEWINRYASVVVRMAREHADEMGAVPQQQVLDGGLDYKDMDRLNEADEKILLRAIVQTLLDRSLCIREKSPNGEMLVFPSYFRRDNPDQPEHPNVFVTYEFSGPLDDVYATLVVRLSCSDTFEKDQLWKDAADFTTPEGKRVGLAMHKRTEGAATIVVYFESGTPDDTKVTFIKYVHEHLLAKARPRESVTRVRTYVCPDCNRPLENAQAIQVRLEMKKKDIGCGFCDFRVPLFDLIEEKFASDEFSRRVRKMDEQAGINLDNESLELILVGHAFATVAEAGHIFRPTANSDWGVDGEIEFKDAQGNASGRRLYLQLKSGDSYLRKRRRDDAEVFDIRKKRQAEYWVSQPSPVMLVIRTSDGKIRWMNITEYLQRHGVDTKQVVFEGEAFTAANVARMRDVVLGGEEE